MYKNAGNTFSLLRKEENQLEKYKNLTDEELIDKLRLGDERIVDFILDKYKPLVPKKDLLNV